MKLFLDTNVMLDFLGERETYYEPMSFLMSLADEKKVAMAVSALSFATVNYFLVKYESVQIAKEKLTKFKILSEVIALSETIIDKSLTSKFKDFEDGLQYFSALEARADILISRNKKDFKLSELPVMTAEEYLKTL